MQRKYIKRITAQICMVCLVASICLDGFPVNATEESNSTDIVTVEDKLAEGFAPWTFSDAGIEDQEVTEATGFLNWGDDWKEKTNERTLDRTIFNGKICFAEDSDKFGNLYIGGDVIGKRVSQWSGFMFRGFSQEIDALVLTFVGTDGQFYDKNGAGQNNIVKISQYEKEGIPDLRGNSDLQISLSVEYTDVTADGLVTMEVGLFLNGELFNNQYYTVKDVPEECLTQNVRWAEPQGSNAVASHSLIDVPSYDMSMEPITLENAPERSFARWTFSDVGMDNYTSFSQALNWNDFASQKVGKSLDKSIFNGKIKWDNLVASSGVFVIGGHWATENSAHRGFRMERIPSTNTISLAFCGTDGKLYNQNGITDHAYNEATNDDYIAIFDSETAGTDLTGNSELQVSFSVEYISEVTDGIVDVKVGVFFDGRLYDNTYYTVKGVPEIYLRQNARFGMASATSGVSNAIASHNMADIVLANAPEQDFAYWTFTDVGITKGSVTKDIPVRAIAADSLDKTIFNGKINFTENALGFGDFYVGGFVNEDLTGADGGFLFRAADADKLALYFQGAGGTYYNEDGVTQDAIAIFDPTIAGVTLRENQELQVSLSVEYISEVTDGNVDIKVGVFFDGKLYDNTYYTVTDVPQEYLKRILRWISVPTGAKSYVTELAKATNVAAASNGTTVVTSHIDRYSENIGYGMATLNDGIATQNAPYYLGITGNLQSESVIFEFTFNREYMIDHIRMYQNEAANGFPVDFQWIVYTDNGWQSVVEKTDYLSTAGWNEIHFDDIACTAVRLITAENGKSGNGQDYGVHLGEVEIWGVTSAKGIAVPYTLGKSAKALNIGRNGKIVNDNVFEGIDSYRLVSATQGVGANKLQYVFNNFVSVDGVQFHCQKPGQFPSAFEIYGFKDGKWELLHTETGYQPGSSFQTMHEFTFASIGSLSSIVIIPTDEDYTLELQEVRVNGDSAVSNAYMLGDGNFSGTLQKEEDFEGLLNVMAGIEELGDRTDVYDMNCDIEVDFRDLVRIARYFE